jgi:Histidine kinase-, DNA gyrase B-, and HSP90-like ATPase
VDASPCPASRSQAVIYGALDAVRPKAEAKTIRLQSVLDPRAGPITGDPRRLQQVIWNLLMNAVKFPPRRERVQAHLRRVDSHVEIVVSDTGQGIAPDVLPLDTRQDFREGRQARKHNCRVGHSRVKPGPHRPAPRSRHPRCLRTRSFPWIVRIAHVGWACRLPPATDQQRLEVSIASTLGPPSPWRRPSAPAPRKAYLGCNRETKG